jgi:predicted nuclease of predicted toxin-antitoxin system
MTGSETARHERAAAVRQHLCGCRVTPRIVSALRQRNYVCQSALEDGLADASDERILERAAQLGMVLLTNNARDFSLLAQEWASQGRQHAGILISEQYRRRQLGEFLRRLLSFLDTVPADEMRGAFR